jgi:hypothetical protein
MSIINNDNIPKLVITETVNDITISTPGPQGPRGKTILNGNGAPAENNGVEGDFYYDKNTTRFYGPKPSDVTWTGATNYLLNAATLTYTFSTNQVVSVGNYYAIAISHNLGYNPNVTVKNSAGDILETGIDYNSINQITLTMAQPFGGTAYLS